MERGLPESFSFLKHDRSVLLKLFAVKDTFKNFPLVHGSCPTKSCCARLARALSHVIQSLSSAAPRYSQTLSKQRRPWSHSWRSWPCQIAVQVSGCLLLTFFLSFSPCELVKGSRKGSLKSGKLGI